MVTAQSVKQNPLIRVPFGASLGNYINMEVTLELS